MPDIGGMEPAPDAQIVGDLELNCSECKEFFILSEGERTFFRSKGLMLPKRCSPCRAARRQEREGGSARPPK